MMVLNKTCKEWIKFNSSKKKTKITILQKKLLVNPQYMTYRRVFPEAPPLKKKTRDVNKNQVQKIIYHVEFNMSLSILEKT
jgi:hypothetical protein